MVEVLAELGVEVLVVAYLEVEVLVAYLEYLEYLVYLEYLEYLECLEYLVYLVLEYLVYLGYLDLLGRPVVLEVQEVQVSAGRFHQLE